MDYTLGTLSGSLLKQERHDLPAADVPGDWSAGVQGTRKGWAVGTLSRRINERTTMCQPQRCWRHYWVDFASLDLPATSMEENHDSCGVVVASQGLLAAEVASRAQQHQGAHCCMAAGRRCSLQLSNSIFHLPLHMPP